MIELETAPDIIYSVKINTLLERMRLSAYNAFENPGEKAIHRFRLNVKKYHSVVNALPDDTSGEMIYFNKVVSKIYKASGKLRELQLLSGILESEFINLNAGEFLKLQGKLFKKKSKARKKFIQQYEKYSKELNRIAELNVTGEFNRISAADRIEFLQLGILRLSHLSKRSTGENHLLRKYIKQLGYLMKLMAPEEPPYFDLTPFKAIAEELGAWHDDLRFRKLISGFSGSHKIKPGTIRKLKQTFKINAAAHLNRANELIETSVLND